MSLELNEQYDKIYRYCYFKVNNTQIAEDLTQETFLKYFAQSSYINRGKQLAYLYTIARNLCADHYRKPDFIPLDEELASKDNLSTLETNLTVKDAINSLHCELQEIILLRFADELSIGEISNITELSRFAVRRRINSALATLKSILREEDFNE